MNNMYDILAKMNLLEGRGVKPDFPDIDRDGDRTEPISKAAKEMDEAMPAPVVKTDSGFTAQAPKGKQLQTTVPKDRPVSPADVKIKEQGDAYGHRGSPTFGHSHRMEPGYDPTFRSPIDSPAGSEIEELEYLMSKGAMTNAEEMRLRSLYNKFGIRSQQDMAKIPQLRQQELERIEKTQAELQRKSAEANVASRDEMERQRAARMGVTPRPQSGVSNDAAFRAAYDRAGRTQPAVREGDELAEQAAFQFSPEQEKFLGNANRQDPYILARMPGPKPPVSYFTDPEDQAIAQRLNFGQQNLNRIKSFVGAKPGDAEMFATGKPATPTDINTTAGFRKAYDQAGKPVGGQTPAPKGPPVTFTPSVPGQGPVAAKKTAGQQLAMPDRGTAYRIKPGDTLTRIAANNGTTVQAIMAVNPQIQDANRIQAGAQLRLPAKPVAGASPGKAVAGGGNIGDITMAESTKIATAESRHGRKPDFPDIDRDGDRIEPIGKAAKEMNEADVEEGNDFTKARLDAIKAGKPTFRLNGKVFKVTGDTSDERRMDEGYVDFMDKKEMYRRIGAEVEGRSDDYTVTFRDGSRKRYQELDGRRRVTTLEPVDAPEEQDAEGNVVKRGRGRPKGTGRKIGTRGQTDVRAKKVREQDMSEDYDKDEYDEEGEMAKSQARTIEDAAKELQDILDDDQNLPEWVQKKIVLAKEYIDSARDYMKANPDEEEVDVDVEVDDEEFMAEKAVSKAQRAAAGIAHAARKGDIPKSELRGASKEMAKMPAGELKKFAKTKEKGLPEKVKEEDKEEVDETTVSGSVATSTDAPKAKKGGMQFGKGVYESQIAESFERKLGMLTEGMNINMSMDENGKKSLTVSATDDDAEQLAAILKMAGLDSQPRTQTCEVCGGHEGMHEAGCGRRDMVEEELANAPDPTYAELGDTRDYGVSGGLNGPKLQSNPNNMADNPLAMRNLGSRGASGQLNLGAMAEDVEQRLENRLMDLYKRIS
jgi:LysM repeat protein